MACQKRSMPNGEKNTKITQCWDKFFRNPQNKNCTKEQVLQLRDDIEKAVWPDAPKGETPIN